ncbi:DUF6919 domain-containing protein [Streptomyces rimosus]|uniref:DUF6919 domain-containing protein n=1 Tax=Streptomyces rimosus TaxID=1927 RepID=UPI003BF50D35
MHHPPRLGSYLMQTRLPWMNRADRARWRSARTLADLGRLTADWWEGSVRSLPGHRASHRPHPSLAAHVPVLAAANRAGFLVAAAQTGLDTARVRRKTAVQGFATDPALIQRLVGAAEKAGLGLVLQTGTTPSTPSTPAASPSLTPCTTSPSLGTTSTSSARPSPWRTSKPCGRGCPTPWKSSCPLCRSPWPTPTSGPATWCGTRSRMRSVV